MMINQMYHLVKISPWPIMSSINLMSLGISFIFLMYFNMKLTLIVSIMLMINNMFMWWSDVNKENLMEGCHSLKAKLGLNLGLMMFIISEFMFFVSFFWNYFYNSLNPDIELGKKWPPLGIEKPEYGDIPLLNTLILLSSGLTVTIAHYSIMSGDKEKFFINLSWTIVLGMYFFLIQIYEYFNLSFDFSSSTYGSSFFIITGFHGIHVFIGMIFLMVNLNFFVSKFSSFMTFLSFDYSIWYWHFVDIIWILLYITIYWW